MNIVFYSLLFKHEHGHWFVLGFVHDSNSKSRTSSKLRNDDSSDIQCFRPSTLVLSTFIISINVFFDVLFYWTNSLFRHQFFRDYQTFDKKNWQKTFRQFFSTQTVFWHRKKIAFTKVTKLVWINCFFSGNFWYVTVICKKLNRIRAILLFLN